MKNPNFSEALEEILREDKRYAEQAYFFIREALDFTIKVLAKPVEGPGRHVSGQEMLDGIRRYALQEFGPLTYTVLKTWGVHQCSDFGALVFNLVDSGVLGKTEDDKPEDFANGYTFEDAFQRPFASDAELQDPMGESEDLSEAAADL